MTICDAAKYLEGLFADKNVGDDIEGIVQEEIEAAQVAVWLLHDRMRRDALQPLDENGLAPCGCGGKAGFHYSVMMRDNDCYVECGICGVHTKVVLSEDKARDAWNTAMGWKGGEK
jgi:hypothetical protein